MCDGTNYIQVMLEITSGKTRKMMTKKMMKMMGRRKGRNWNNIRPKFTNIMMRLVQLYNYGLISWR